MDVELDSLKYEDVEVGIKVIDGDDNIGVIKDCFDIRNIIVEYLDGGSGLYCLDSTCNNYDPLYKYGI